MLARKRIKKPLDTSGGLTKQTDFKIAPEEIEVKETPKKEKKIVSEPSAILDEILKKDTRLEVNIPKQLPTVDFMDEPSNTRQSKFKRNDKNTDVDYANQPMKKFEKPQKRPKNKFSKVSNPYPNDQAKNPKEEAQGNPKKVEAKDPKEVPGSVADSETSRKKLQKSQAEVNIATNKKKHGASSNGSSNTNVFTADSVDSLKIHPFSIKNMKEVLNFHKLTHVQQKSIPAALEGKDLLIRSPTGKFFCSH